MTENLAKMNNLFVLCKETSTLAPDSIFLSISYSILAEVVVVPSLINFSMGISSE